MPHKLTLDHNCIIHLENRTPIGTKIAVIVADPQYECFVVNIGASEMLEKGVRPDRYDKFGELLELAGIDHLPRIDPMMIGDVTFWDRGFWASDEMIKLSDAIREVLFGASPAIDLESVGRDSPTGRKWVNQACDVETMRSHIDNGNEIFLTTDRNFTKATKLPKLIALGAGRICHPCDL